MNKYIFSMIIILLMLGCSSKTALVHSYNVPKVDLNIIKFVNLHVNGSKELESTINSKIPVLLNEKELLVNNFSSNTKLEITELHKKRYVKKYENKKTDYSYKVGKEYSKYTEYCLDTTYFLTANLKLKHNGVIIMDHDFTATTTKKKCRNNKLDVRDAFELEKKYKLRKNELLKNNTKIIIVNNGYNPYYCNAITSKSIIDHSIEKIHNIQASSYNDFYSDLIQDISKQIIRYLVPHRISYNVHIEDELDIEMTTKDEKSFEVIISSLEKEISQYNLSILLKLENKYPMSYAIKYNIGVYFEKIEDNINALQYYNKALNIKVTKFVIQRINQVKSNAYSLKKIKKI